MGVRLLALALAWLSKKIQEGDLEAGLDDFEVQGEMSPAFTACSGARRRTNPGVAVEALGFWTRHRGVALSAHGTLFRVPSGPEMEARSEVPPQPVETCSFCFPERRSPTQESTRTLGILGLAGTAAPQPCARTSVGGLGVVRVPIGDVGPGA